MRDLDGVPHYPIALWTNGVLEIRFDYLSRRPPFNAEVRRREFLERLNQVPGVGLPPSAYKGAPNFPIAVLANESSWIAFEDVLRWYLVQIGAERAGDPPGSV